MSGITSTLSKQPIALRSPKLLFVANYFPPLQGSACVRTWNIAKHLARMGWEVTVVTPDPAVWRHCEDPHKVAADLDREGIRRLLSGHRWSCLSPDLLDCWNRGLGWLAGGLCRRVTRYFGVDQGIGWVTEAERACASLRETDVDVILASGPPFASFMLAKRLADKLRRPYVLDYRDPWPKQGNGQHSERVIRRTEEALVDTCSAVIAISKSLLSGQKGVSSKLIILTNGFDPEELGHIRPYDFGHFAIVYTGTFYPPKRVITPVMEALKILKTTGIDQRIPWRFHYYGPQGDHVRLEAERCGVWDKTEVHGRVTRGQALSAIRGSGLSIVITSVLEEKAEADGGIVTGKVFDALGLGTPTLVIGPSGADVEAIVTTTGLARIVPAKNIFGIASFLEEAMVGKVPPRKDPQAYSWPNLITRFDEVLRDSIVRGDAQ